MSTNLYENLSDFVKFNANKHHLGFLQESITRWRKSSWPDALLEISGLGENQFDMYTGRLSPDQIVNETTSLLKRIPVRSREALHHWLGVAGYRSLMLSDASRWVVRECNDPDSEKFIHIHPGRRQANVIRMKATHAKTAIAVILTEVPPDAIFMLADSFLETNNLLLGNSIRPFKNKTIKPDTNPEEGLTAAINRIRTEKLSLSPVRSVAESKKIVATCQLIISTNRIPHIRYPNK